MAIDLGNAYVTVIPSAQGATGAIVNALGGQAAGLEAGKKVGAGLVTALKKYAAPLAAVAAGFSIAKFVKSSEKAFLDLAGAVKGFQRTAGGSVEQASALRGAIQLSGADVDKTTASLAIFAKKLAGANDGGEKAASMAKVLGGSFTDATGQLLPMNELLPKVADKFKEMPDGPQKTALALQLFGKQGQAMLPFLNQGAEGIAALTAKAGQMGLVLDDVSMKIMGKSKSSAREFTTAMQGMKVAVGQNVVPIVTATQNLWRQGLTPLIQAATGVIGSHRDQILGFADRIQAAADRIGTGIAGIISLLQGDFTPALREAFGLEEDSAFVARFLSLRTRITAGVSGVKALLRGDFTPALREAFGLEEDSAFVARFLSLRTRITAGVSGVKALLRGDFTPALREGFGLEEDSAFVARFLSLRARVGPGVRGLVSLLRGDFTPALTEAFGIEEDSAFVDRVLDIRDRAGAAFAKLAGSARTMGTDLATALSGAWTTLTTGELDPAATGLGRVLQQLAAAGRTLWDAVAPAVVELAPKVLALAQAWSPWRIVLDGIAPVLPVIGAALSDIALAAAGALSVALPVAANALSDIAVALTGGISAAAPVAAELFTSLADVVPLASGALVTLIPLVTQIAVGLIHLATPLLASETVVKTLAVAFLGWKAALAGIALHGLISGLVTSTSTLWANTTAWAANTRAQITSKAQTAALVALYVKDWLVAVARSTGALAVNTAGWLRNTASLVAHKAASVATAVASRTMAAAQAAVTAAQWAMNAALNANPIGIVIAAIAALVGALVWLYQNNETVRRVIDAAWGGIKTAISSVASWWTGTAWPAIKQVTDAFGAGFQAAGAIISAAWEGIRAGAGAAWGWINQWVIAPFKFALASVGAVFEFQKNLWVGAFNAVRDGLMTGWNWVNNNVFAPFKVGIGLIGTAFDNLKTGIARAWEGIKAAAAAPINFVLGTVYNNGIREWWNKVAGAVGLDSLKLPTATLVQFAHGTEDHRAQIARAGAMRLWAEPETGGEAYIPLAPAKRARSMQILSAVASRFGVGVVPFADGGVWGTLGGFASDVWQGVQAIGEGIWDAAGMAAKILTDPLGAVKSALVDGIIEPALAKAGAAGDLIKVVGALPGRFADGLAEKVRSLLGEKEKQSGLTSAPPAGAGMGVAAMTAALHALMPGARVTSGYRPGAVSVTGARSMHGLGRAIDIGAGNGYSLSQIWDTLNSAYGTRSFQLLYTPKGAQQIWWNHQRSNTPMSIQRTHHDHVHWAMANGGILPTVPTLYDSGGMLPPGVSVVENRTNAPEPVFTGNQFDALAGGRAKLAENINIHGPDPETVVRELERRERRKRLLSGSVGRL